MITFRRHLKDKKPLTVGVIEAKMLPISTRGFGRIVQLKTTDQRTYSIPISCVDDIGG